MNSINSEKFDEVEKKLESYEKEKNKLKQVISILYDKTIVINKLLISFNFSNWKKIIK